MTHTIAIDNGTSGTIGILGPDTPFFDEVPTKPYLMGKAGKVIQRIDHVALAAMISGRINAPSMAHCYVERPFTGSAMMINTTVLAARSHEVVLVVMELLSIGVTTVDSKEWQVPVLGAVKGSAELKKASMLRGMALYPQFAKQIKSHGDADGLLMAHHFHRKS